MKIDFGATAFALIVVAILVSVFCMFAYAANVFPFFNEERYVKDQLYGSSIIQSQALSIHPNGHEVVRVENINVHRWHYTIGTEKGDKNITVSFYEMGLVGSPSNPATVTEDP